MIARSNKLTHPLGLKIETPLLVPSFSSKGFAFKSKKKGAKTDISEVTDVLVFSKEFLTESLLISAYDLHYKHIPYSEEHLITEVTLIDSGGYEAGNTYDISTTTKYNYDLKPWSPDLLKTILDKWPKHKAAIAVSFDDGNHRISLEDQIRIAKQFFANYPDMLSNFLIKPETKEEKYVQVDNVLGKISELDCFNIIGFTERELGSSILHRMQNIYKIRKKLDESNITSPLHIFGSLDPITTILYFLAGAEIFDGLTWLKYSYLNNSAIYIANFGILGNDLDINITDGNVRSMSITRNIYYLENMKHVMKEYLLSKDFSAFDKLGGHGFGTIIEKSYNRFISNL